MTTTLLYRKQILACISQIQSCLATLTGDKLRDLSADLSKLIAKYAPSSDRKSGA